MTDPNAGIPPPPAKSDRENDTGPTQTAPTLRTIPSITGYIVWLPVTDPAPPEVVFNPTAIMAAWHPGGAVTWIRWMRNILRTEIASRLALLAHPALAGAVTRETQIASAILTRLIAALHTRTRWLTRNKFHANAAAHGASQGVVYNRLSLPNVFTILVNSLGSLRLVNWDHQILWLIDNGVAMNHQTRALLANPTIYVTFMTQLGITQSLWEHHADDGLSSGIFTYYWRYHADQTVDVFCHEDHRDMKIALAAAFFLIPATNLDHLFDGNPRQSLETGAIVGGATGPNIAAIANDYRREKMLQPRYQIINRLPRSIIISSALSEL